MKVLIQTLGSAGDTHPFIGIGKGLHERGHDVYVFANEVFAEAVRDAGLHHVEMGDSDTFLRLAADPDVWHSRKGIKIVLRAVVDHLEQSVALIEDHLDGAAVLVNSSLGFASRIVRELHGIPLVTAHLAPSLIRSTIRLPHSEVMLVSDGSPEWARRLWWRVGDLLVDRILLDRLNAIRRDRELDPVERVLQEWAVFSPDRTLGLFPDWFGPPQPDWRRPIELTGFPLYDESDHRLLDPALFSWLSAGDSPVVFTAGSANRHARKFFEQAVSVCRQLGLRCLLITSEEADVPTGLPASIRHESYVPFSQVLPEARALVSHGGVGTCAQALASGIPHLVTHINFDQRDNGSRVTDLGSGAHMPMADFKGGRALRALSKVLGTQPTRRASELSYKVDGEAAVAAACDEIEAAERLEAYAGSAR